MFIRELDQSITSLTGIGKKTQEEYKSLGVSTIADLLLLRPRGYEDRSHRVCIGHQGEGSESAWTNTIVKAESVGSFGPGRKNVKISVRDTQSGQKAFLMGFNRSYLSKAVFPGCYYRLYANISCFGTALQASQFELSPLREEPGFDDEVNLDGGILPVYALSGNLTQKTLRRDTKAALARCTRFDDELPQSLMDKYRLMDFDTSIREIHFPSSEKALVQARRTLAFSEVFYLQMETMRKASSDPKSPSAFIAESVSDVERHFVSSLPFELTLDQNKVLDEIRHDMARNDSMSRLLQGDVGSGKTLVAWISALHVIASGGQVAFMAPTELLARQHAQNASDLLASLGVRVAFLNGEVHGKPRQALLRELEAGNIDLLIGTHALFSKDVSYRNLKYVVIDEQHRFGVEQREALLEKGADPHVLLMTATPIPRTLALTVFGNLNVSTIRTMPKGRLPVITHLIDDEKRQRMYDAVGVEMKRGHQAYFVYPRIDDDGPSSLRDVQTMYEYLSTTQYTAYRGALIHSRLPEEEKIAILNAFAAGRLDYLVSTSVVEVGIDVPNATCMIVEHAEVFGLSALHQLRGRVGRSTLQSWCFLVYEDSITEDGKKRLSVLRRTNDGFEIAEEDLRIRGPGELSGLRQSGFIHLRYADLEKDVPMMEKAREEVSSILRKDPGLISLENGVIRKTLALRKR